MNSSGRENHVSAHSGVAGDMADSSRETKAIAGRSALPRSERGVDVSDSPESVARDFLAALEDFTNVDGIVSFFAEDGVYIDPMRGVQRGTDELRREFTAQAAMGFDNVKIDVKSLVAGGGTVMMERVDSWTVGSKPFKLELMAVIEIAADGHVKRWRDCYDSKPITEQLSAAGYRVPS